MEQQSTQPGCECFSAPLGEAETLAMIPNPLGASGGSLQAIDVLTIRDSKLRPGEHSHL
jgi:hypothetical protein